MNKSTKITLNYLVGSIIAILLLWGITIQLHKQFDKVDPQLWDNLGKYGTGYFIQTIRRLLHTGPDYLLYITLVLMPVNLGLEAWKWRLLAGSAQRLSYRQALCSYLAGIAFSIITPNRIGEYPGRLIYLKRKNTFRLISVSVLGMLAQMLTLFIYGCAGLAYYNIYYANLFSYIVLAICIALTVVIAIVYWKFDIWMPVIERIRWLRKYEVYGKLLKRFGSREQLTILIISLIRYAIYTAQYLILLRWMNVDIPFTEGFFMSALFFWVIAIIPSISLVELGERGQVGLYLFHHLSDNTIGILTATLGIWCINLILPAIAGSLLLIRMRFIR